MLNILPGLLHQSRKDFGFGYEESEDDNFAQNIRKLFLEPHPENAFGDVVIPDDPSMDPRHTHNTDATWDEAVTSIRYGCSRMRR